MDLCDALGIDRVEVVRMRDSKTEQIPEWEGEKKQAAMAARFLVSDYFRTALSFYFLGDHQKCREYARGCIHATSENFFGKWRQTTKTDDDRIDPPWWKKAMNWIDRLRYAGMWGGAIGDWKGVEKLAAYPDDECVQGKEGAEAKSFYLAVASHLRRDSSKHTTTYLRQAIEGHAKRIRLLADVFQAIRDNDATRTNAALNEYLKYYKRRIFPANCSIRISPLTARSSTISQSTKESNLPLIRSSSTILCDWKANLSKDKRHELQRLPLLD